MVHVLYLFAQILPNPLAAQFLAGGTAGVMQWLPPVYCLDVIKSRMQTAPKGFYSGVGDCVVKLYSEYGAVIFVRYTLTYIASDIP